MRLVSINGSGKNKTEILNQYALILILGLIFLNPFPHTTFIDQLLFYAALIPMMIMAKKKYAQFYCDSPLLYPLALFFLWSVVSVVFALDKLDSAHVLYSHLIRYLIFYLVLINLFNTKKRLVSIAVCIVCSEIVFAIGAFIYYYFILDYELTSRFLLLQTPAIASDVVPFGFIPGALLAGWLFKIFRNRYQRLLLGGAILVLLICTLLTQSRGAFLALSISFPILFWNHKKVLGLLLIATVVFLSQSPLKNRVKPDRLFDDKSRPGLICYSIEIIKDYPIVGTGFSIGTFRNSDYIDEVKYSSRIPKKYHHKNNEFSWPHNMFLSMGVRSGVVGMILYASLFIVSIFISAKLILYSKDLFIQTHARCCLALLTMFLVNGVLQVVTTHFIDTILFMIFSMVTIIWKINQDAEADESAEMSGRLSAAGKENSK